MILEREWQRIPALSWPTEPDHLKNTHGFVWDNRFYIRLVLKKITQLLLLSHNAMPNLTTHCPSSGNVSSFSTFKTHKEQPVLSIKPLGSYADENHEKSFPGLFAATLLASFKDKSVFQCCQWIHKRFSAHLVKKRALSS